MIVGMLGYAKHGKDTAGHYLVENYGFKRYAFADQLKVMALTLNPIVQTYSFPKHPERLATLVSLLGWDKAKEIAEVRRFLQVLGTEAAREIFGADVWINALVEKLDKDGINRQNSDLVVTDVRFPNEAEFIRRNGGEIWRIKRLNEDGSEYDNGLGKDHPSEKFIEVIKADRTFAVATIENLETLIEGTMKGRSRL